MLKTDLNRCWISGISPFFDAVFSSLYNL